MKLIKRGRVYHAKFKTPHGTKVVTTKCTDREEAEKVVKASGLKDIESAAKSGVLSREAISRITTGKKLTIQKALAHYIKWLESVGKAPKTIENNTSTVAAWARDAKVENVPPSAIDETHINQWINREDESKANTRATALAAIRSFFGYCAAKGWSLGDPARLVKVNMGNLSHEQKEVHEKRTFTDFELKRLKKHLSDTEQVFWLFATAISEEMGLRLGDICQLEWSCFNIPNHIIVWTDKRDKRISVPISDDLNDIITMIPVHSHKYLFPEQREIILDLKRRSSLSVKFSRLLESQDIQGKSFHCLRHTCATRWAKQGKSLGSIGKDLGHSDEKTTKGYVHEVL